MSTTLPRAPTESRAFELAVLWIVTVGAALACWFWGGNEPWDDAFISYRYAVHLAEGHGLVWNIGGEPTQGYTNFLFVVLLAAGVLVGCSPITTAFALNVAGLLLAVTAAYALCGPPLPERRRVALLPPLAIVALPFTPPLLLCGLETTFVAGLLFAAADRLARYLQTGSTRTLALFVALALCSCLTRPDSVVPVAGWMGIAVLALRGAERRRALGGFAALSGLGGLHLLWMWMYFGAVLPNSFHVKVDQPAGLPGLEYVKGYLEWAAASVPFLVGIVAFARLALAHGRFVVPFVAIAGLLPAYLFVSPLMGGEYRFLYPAACILAVAATCGFVHALDVVLAGCERLARGLSVRPEARRIGVGVVVVIATYAAFLAGGAATLRERVSDGLSATRPTSALLASAEALARVPGIENALIAYGDAGAVPFFTRARSLDPVGLNDNEIARYAPQRGPDWVVDYVLSSEPDLIGVLSFYDGRLFDRAHGVMKDYGLLYADPRLRERYVLVASVRYRHRVINHWFARIDSPVRDGARAALRAVVMARPPELRP